MNAAVCDTHTDAEAGSEHLSADSLSLLSRLGETAALLEQGRLVWASRTWQAAWPSLPEGSKLAVLDAALPGLLLALQALAPSGLLQPLSLSPAAQWEASALPLAPGRCLLRLKDRRERARVLQRQLDDREQLLFTSRVISVGEMATTLAHELNQPIGAASNLLRGLRMRLARRAAEKPAAALSSEESGALERALEQLSFAARVITRIREFTHSRQPRLQRLDLAALLRESLGLLDWDLQRSEVQLSLDLPSQPLLVRGDAVMLQQVLVNLMRNALDAMRQPPAQTVPRLGLRLRSEQGQALLQVQDNGCGLSEAAEKNLFVPFASTKPSGMGVGLAICRSFIELHQGRLWFSRNPERGCSFHIDLPLDSGAPASAADRLAAPSPQPIRLE
ncbi:sensor histidine kinase [Kinneretia aquatilis]|nr:ATP-binding protein [Paucibacter aquatile]